MELAVDNHSCVCRGMKLKIFTFCGKSVILENNRNLRRSKEAFEFRIRYVYENIRKIQRHFTFVYGIIKQEYDQRKRSIRK